MIAILRNHSNRGSPEGIVTHTRNEMERSDLHVSRSDLRKAHQNKIVKRWLSKHSEGTNQTERTTTRRRRNLAEDMEARTSALILVC
jgi:hypothetical protein